MTINSPKEIDNTNCHDTTGGVKHFTKQQWVILNDIVISKKCSDGEEVSSTEIVFCCQWDNGVNESESSIYFNATGLIVSTTTGSTAYNLSAGGSMYVIITCSVKNVSTSYARRLIKRCYVVLLAYVCYYIYECSVHPMVPAILVTPICPRRNCSLSTSPMILPLNTVLKISFKDTSYDGIVNLCFDGHDKQV